MTCFALYRSKFILWNKKWTAIAPLARTRFVIPVTKETGSVARAHVRRTVQCTLKVRGCTLKIQAVSLPQNRNGVTPL